MEFIKHTNPSKSTVETDNNSAEEEMSAIEMNVTRDANCTNVNRILEDINLCSLKPHAVAAH